MKITKFRIYDDIDKKMYPVSKINFDTGEVFYYDDPDLPFPTVRRVKIEKTDLMQFTGMLDKKGKEIYEGDIVKKEFYINYEDHYKSDEYIGHIVFENGTFLIKDEIKKVNRILGPLEDFTEDFKHLEVIGNVYKNPYMLEEPKVLTMEVLDEDIPF